ncbi:MAG: peptidoglycan recognition family protein [Patescibacteria group bacterium]
MAKYFNEEKWSEAIRHPDWYLRIFDDYQNLIKRAEQGSAESADGIKEETYKFFEDNLADNNVVLGKEGPNWDEERKPIDTIVIHHTKSQPGISWQKLSAMHLIRLYGDYYSSPYNEAEKHLRGQAIFSHHFRDNRQVFYAYHWLVRMDGTIERLLNDDEIGWQAGNWNVNCRSVAVCLDNNFENSSPSDLVLGAVAKLIQKYYPQVSLGNIQGHREINPKTTCPGNQFLGGWKLRLEKLLK